MCERSAVTSSSPKHRSCSSPSTSRGSPCPCRRTGARCCRSGRNRSDRSVIALVGDTEIAYDDVGSGLPVVFLHAFPLNRTMWDPQLGALVGECRCIAIDLRGFGDSKGAEPYTMDRYADDVAGVLDTLQIERAVIVGLSMGGYVAFAFWRRHRERVRGLVLADTRASADTIEVV